MRGVGKVAEGLGRVGVTALNQAFDAGLDIPSNPLEGAADATHRLGERVLASRTDEAKRREADSRPGGDLDKPDTWTFGRNPSASGLALQGLNALGSSAIPIAASVAAGPAGIGARMAAGATAGGAMGGGNAIEQARETIDGMDDQQLAAASSAYRDLIAQGVPPQEARARVRADAENAAFVRTVPVSAIGGAATGKILSPAGRVLGDRGVLAQTAGKAALAGTEEALQEVGEGVATQKGINAGASMDLDPLAGSFGNAALGFVAGMGPGAVHGAAEGVRHRSMATAPTMEAGDVVHASGKPFITASAARQRAEELGGDAQVLRFENGFIVRPGAGAPAQELVPHPRRRATRRRLRARQPKNLGPVARASRQASSPTSRCTCARAAARSPSSSSAWSATPRRPGLAASRWRGSARPTAAGISSACRSCTPTRSPATPCARRPTCRRRSKARRRSRYWIAR